ncbi:MAG: DegT/DnrJ/EryC1/StrS family aminotransferase [Cyanobium sp.]
MIPQIQPWLDESETKEVLRVMESTYLTENQVTAEFEHGLASLTGAKHAIAVCNGTAALYCILKALSIGHGDEVIVPDMTFIASSNAVVMAGAKPVFAPIKKETLDFDWDYLPNLISPSTKAIMPVHLYGHSADLEAVSQIRTRFNLKVIEDAAQAIGVTFNDRHVGCFGEAGAISFYGNKTITCGEGGVILTNHGEIAQACQRLKNHGRSQRGTFIHEHIGFNFSMTEMQAAVGVAQLRKLPAIIQRKQEIYTTYNEAFADIPQLKRIPIDERCQPVHWFTSFYAENRESLGDYLMKHGIQTRLFFCPLHMQPCYAGWSDESIDYCASKESYADGISLPSSYILTNEELRYIIATVRRFYLPAETVTHA